MAGAFICQVSENDWPVCLSQGVYGNRENKPDTTQPLRLQDRLSVIRDMISIRAGDLLFFHVIGGVIGPSGLYGPYQAASIPYYDQTNIWESDLELFPFRIAFKPFTGYEEICETNLSIRISDVYAAIENRSIWSLATLENERNIERRAVRRIAQDDGQTILNIFLREFDKEASSVSVNTPSSINVLQPLTPMGNQIEGVGRYENAIKALLLDKLANRDSSCTSIFPDYVDFMNETFVAPTTRKLMDILIVSKVNGGAKHYYIVEAKTGKFTQNDISQLLQYVDLFRQRPIFNLHKDNISACALAASFDNNTITFRNLHNNFCHYDNLILVKYEPNTQGTDAKLGTVPPETHPQFVGGYLVPSKWEITSPKKEIVEKTSTMLPFYSHNRYVSRCLKERIEDNGFIIEERSIADNSVIGIYFVFVVEGSLSLPTFKGFLDDLFQRVAPLVSFNFRAISPVLIFRGYEPAILDYISIYNDLSIRRPIVVYEY